MEIIGPSKGGGIATAYTALAETLSSSEPRHDVTILFTERSYFGDWNEHVVHYASLGIGVMSLWDDLAVVNANVDVAYSYGCTTRACVRAYRVYLWLKSRTGAKAKGRKGSWFDIVHFHDNGGIGYFSQLAKHQGEDGFEDLVFFHGAHGPHLWERYANEYLLEDLRHLEIDHFERRMAELSDVVVSPSAYMLQWMAGMDWQLPKHTYAHQNILPKPLFQVDEGIAVQSSVNIDEVVFFGRLERRKGLFTFLNALALLTSPNITMPNITVPQAGTNITLPNPAMHQLRNVKISFMGRTTLVDPMTMAHQLIDRWCKSLFLNCSIMSDLSHHEAISYLSRPNLFAVIASPIDNSPNTVLECLSYKIKFIASNVGGIPELIHPDERSRVLFEPNAKDLSRLLRSILVLHEPLAPVNFAVPNEVRQSLWVDLHSHLIPELFVRKTRPQQDNNILVSVCVRIWCSGNFSKLLNSIAIQNYQNTEVILGIPNACYSSVQQTVTNSFSSLNVQIITMDIQEDKEIQSWYELSKRAKGTYFLFIEHSSWLLQQHSLSRLLAISHKTGAGIVSSSYLDVKGNETIVAYPGCTGGNGVANNCFGSWNILVNAKLFAELAPRLTSSAEIWELYALAFNSGHQIESAVEVLFAHSKLDPSTEYAIGSHLAPSVITSPSRQRIIHDYAAALPSEYEAYMLISSHCLVASRDIPTQEELTQHVELLFVRGFPCSGVYRYMSLMRVHPRMHFLPGTAHFQLLSRSLREFISPPHAASDAGYTLFVKKWFLMFVRGFMVSQIVPEEAGSYAWAGEASVESVNPVIPSASYLLARRDGRDVMVSYYFKALWCMTHGDDLRCQERDHGESAEELFLPEDLEAYKTDDQYFIKNPHKLFAQEREFRTVARAWAVRVTEDEEAILRMTNHSIDSRVFQIEYDAYSQYPREAVRDMMAYLGLGSDPDSQNFVDLSELRDDDVIMADGEWEAPLVAVHKQMEEETKMYEYFFTPSTTDWFKEEAGDALILAKYETDKNW